MKGKRQPNHQETRGRLNDRRTLEDRAKSYPTYDEEFGYCEGDTMVERNIRVRL